MTIPVAVFNLVLSKNSSILTAIKQSTNTQIDVDKHTRQSSNRVLTVRLECCTVCMSVFCSSACCVLALGFTGSTS